MTPRTSPRTEAVIFAYESGLIAPPRPALTTSAHLVTPSEEIVSPPQPLSARALKPSCTKVIQRSTLSQMRGSKGASAMLLALTALLVVAVPASSAHGLWIQTSINPGGRSGRLSVTRSSFDSISWEACAAKLTECRPWSRGSVAETHAAPAGTVFRVESSEGRVGLSPEWKGPLQELTPPRVAGDVQANGYVTPVRGLWNGGWRDEPSEMQLSACETEDGEGCVSLTDPHYIRRCPRSSSFYLGPQFVGRYLRVADRQDGGPHYETAIGAIWPYGAEVFEGNRNTSVAIVGQIAPAVDPPAGECGPSPVPTAAISSEGIARVECGGGCSVVLLGTRNGRRQMISRQIPEQDLLRPSAALELRLTSAQLASLGAGKVRLIVKIDGQRSAQRTIRTSAS